MGQQEILEYLEKQKEPILASKMMRDLEIDESKMFKILRILIKHEEVLFHEVAYPEAQKLYGIPRRVKLYYVNPDL